MTSSLAYWIEGVASGNKVWFKVPELPANATKYFAISKKSGYAPNINNVMEWADDFSSTSGLWAGNTSNLSVSGGNGTFTFTANKSVYSAQTFVPNDVYGYSLMGKHKATEMSSSTMFGFLKSDWTRRFTLYRDTGGHNWTMTHGTSSTNINTNWTTGTSYSIKEFIWLKDSVRWYEDSTQKTGSPQTTLSYISTDAMSVMVTGAYSTIVMDWVCVRKAVVTEPTVSVEDKNGYYLVKVVNNTASALTDYQVAVYSTDLGISSADASILIVPADTNPVPYWTGATMQLVSTVGIVDRIPIASTLSLASTFDRMRSFGDVSALASESVDISKSVNDTMWVLTTTVRGDSPAEFFHYAYDTKDHNGADQVLFTGFTPDTVNRHTALQNQSDVVMYDYGWYLSAQYLPDDALVINLGGNRTTWAEWIKYLLEGTGITPYRIASSTADDKEFNFTARTTKRDAIDTISKYCGFIFVVGWSTSTPPEPIAYWIDQEDIDDPSAGLDLPAAVTITWPDPHLVEIPSVQGTPEEKINRVRVRGSDTSGNWYSATMQTPALTTGEEIAREYYEESSAWNSQAKVNARALALYNYFTTTTYTVEAKLLKRMDLRLYQKIRFQGSGFSSRLTSLGWLRIIEINYHVSGIEKYVTIKAVTDKGQLSLLLERMNYAAGGTISDIDTIVSNQISSIPMTEVGTVLSISGDIATVQTESGKIVQARVIS